MRSKKRLLDWYMEKLAILLVAIVVIGTMLFFISLHNKPDELGKIQCTQYTNNSINLDGKPFIAEIVNTSKILVRPCVQFVIGDNKVVYTMMDKCNNNRTRGRIIGIISSHIDSQWMTCTIDGVFIDDV